MEAAYDSEDSRIVLRATPKELEALAALMRHREATDLAGASTIVTTVSAVDFWRQEPLEMTVDIAYIQGGDN